VSTAGYRTMVCTEAGELYSFGSGWLGHGGNDDDEPVPRLVEALAGKKVAGAAAGSSHTVVWTEGGEVYTFGVGDCGQLGHGGEEEEELVPRVVEALAGKRVVGAAAGGRHAVVWTEGGEVYTFGHGYSGQLGHGGTERELVPRVVEALANA
jgi:regulator of chromosome condensation